MPSHHGREGGKKTQRTKKKKKKKKQKQKQKKKNPLVKLGKPLGHITQEKKASEVVGLPSSAAQAVYCPTLTSDILMDYKIGGPLSWAVQRKDPA